MVFTLYPNTTLSDFSWSKEKKEAKVGEGNEMFQQQLLASVCLLPLEASGTHCGILFPHTTTHLS